MQRKFKIDISFIKELKNNLLLYDPSNIDIERLDILIRKLENNFEVDDTNDKSLNNLRDNLEYYNDFKHLYKIVRKFASTGMYIDSIATPTYNVQHLSNEECLALANDFFKNQGEFFYQKFYDFYKDADSHLEFISPNNSTDGEIHYFNSYNEAFVFVPDHDNFTKASILIHECEHVIDSFNNPNFYNNLIIREVAAIFMEMIGVGYLGNQLNLSDAPYMRRLSLHSIVKLDAYTIFLKNQLLYLINENKRLSDKKLKRILYNKYNMSYKFIEFCNQYNLYEDYYYQISQLIAIELFDLYKKDKDKALYILKDIIMNGTDDNIFAILDKYNILLIEHVEQYEDELCKKLSI